MDNLDTQQFARWFDGHYRRPAESRTLAITRFAAEMEITTPVVYFALKGTRISVDIAKRIRERTGGEVSFEALTLGPKRVRWKRRAA